jgi:peptide/nickel transport system permease protein
MPNLKLIVGIVLLLVIVLAAIAGPSIARAMFPDEDPTAVASFLPLQDPSSQHPLGTDQMGRDATAVLFNGIRLSLVIGLVAGIFSTVIGITIGFAAGYLGGKSDTVLRVTIDMFLVFPTLPLLLIVALYIPRWTLVNLGLLLGAFAWPFVSRTVRAQVLSLRERPYVDLARLNNESTLEIIFQELVPNLLPYIFLSLSGAVVGAILAEAGLQIIGIGAGGLPTLGYMLGQGYRGGMISAGLYGQMLVPAAILVALFLALNLVNMGLEERFNPRLRTVAEEQ